MMLRAFALLSVTLAGFALAPRTPAPGSPPDTDSRVMQVASTDLKHHSLTHVLRWLGRQTSVRSVSLGPDGRTVDVRFRDGRHIAILPASLGSVRLPRSFRPEVNSRSRSMAPGPGRALVLEPFATELGLGPNAGDVEVADLHAAGFAVDQLYNTSVDVNSMKLLSQYNLVYMHTHSGFITGGLGLIATGQPFNNDPSMSPLIQNGSVVEAFVSGTDQHYYAITATYLTDYEGQFARDSLVFFNGCNVLNAPDVWHAMQAKGLGVLVSWDAEATSLDNYFAGVAFFGGMRGQGVTVAQSIQQAQAAGYGKSTNNGQTARLGYLGDGTITLQRAAAGQLAVTPVPSRRAASTHACRRGRMVSTAT